jgi:hypothetical protein
MVEHLSDFPRVVVRVACNLCNRSGQYKLFRLAAKYGPEISVDDLFTSLPMTAHGGRKGLGRPARTT